MGSFVTALVSLAVNLGKGCGQSCIESAEWEQIYEAAADNLDTACQKNWISTAQAQAGINGLIQAGQQSIQKISAAGVHAQRALQNMTSVNQAEINGLPPNMDGTTPLPAGWQSELYPPIGQTGWYASSTSQAQQISVPFIQSCNAQNTASSSVSSVVSSISSNPIVASVSKATGMSSSTLLLIGAAIAAVHFL